MNDSGPTPLFLNENPVAVPIPRAVQQAYFWGVAGLGAVAAIAVFVFAVATQSGTDAERIVGVRADTTLSALTSAMAATHGRPGAL
ncbi:hypothetical protein G3T14_05225 [Methylobacterium sp. BTF04]|uniref:hypothetical protein n=1 Tax=Methylobacterium sp. BTF04 TaxID=2708300 RepID=UPI0013D6E22C|nr:hypothetical protein [Methylobacterium sp. BTF04]NEU11528.1 hypothetical protein [Methylobacterium sp. BTF04]